jgi:hypothetical protein
MATDHSVITHEGKPDHFDRETAPATATWRRRLGKAALVTAGLVTSAVGIAGYKIPRDILLVDSTSQEQQIEQAYKATYNSDSARVRCRSGEELGKYIFNGNIRLGPRWIGGFGIPLTNTVWLDSRYCDTLTSIPELQPTHDNFANIIDQNHSTDTILLLRSIGTAAHEGEHAFRNTISDDRAECYALQDGVPLALSLGAPAALKKDMENELLTTFTILHEDMPADSLYQFGTDCRKNGPLDLNATYTGDFPY